jgi:hypothetical protein
MKRVLFLPKWSEMAPAGALKKMPVIVEAATINPTSAGLAPRPAAKRGRSGVRAML